MQRRVLSLPSQPHRLARPPGTNHVVPSRRAHLIARPGLAQPLEITTDACYSRVDTQSDQCANTDPLPSETRSNGNARLHAAVNKNTPTEANSGNEGEMLNSAPADIGAMTPVLPSVQCTGS